MIEQKDSVTELFSPENIEKLKKELERIGRPESDMSGLFNPPVNQCEREGGEG